MSADETPRLLPLSDSQREAMEEATVAYQAALSDGASRYLDARGIGWEAQASFRLGEVGEAHPGHGRFAGMLAIPYLDKDGHPLSIRFRCMKQHDHREHHHGKYNTVTGEAPRMFNVGAVHRAALTNDEIHVAEGELDAVILTILGLDAVAIPGANIWSARHRRMLAGFNRVHVWADPDDGGELLANKILQSMRQAKTVRLTHGDVGETYLRDGGDALLGLIKRR